MTQAEPSIRIPAAARRFQGQRAGIITRFAAAIIDLGVVVGLVAVLYAVIFGISFILHPRHPHWPDLSWSLWFIGVVIAIPYLALTWTTTGRSVGNTVLGTRVVSRRSQRLGFFVAILRAIICVLFPVGLFWCVVSRKKRSVQDVLLRTIVIYDWEHAVPE
jgi:uncharacterized RDD family membrane protein YckC